MGEALIPSEIEMSMGYSAGLMDATKAEGSGLPFENFQTGPQSFDFSGGDSAVPDPNRWRELFPLPASPLPVHASGSSTCSRRRRAKVRTRVSEANEIVRCLNEMYHPRKKSYDIETPTLAQHSSQHAIYKQLQRRPALRHSCTEREAIEELLHHEVAYTGETCATTVRPYDRSLVSLPDCGSKLVPLDQVLDAAGREVVGDPHGRMLVSEAEWGEIVEKGETVMPYMDVTLQKCPELYHQFILDLYEKNLISFTSKPQGLVTPFFVAKKNGRLRFILDCRAVNRRFHPPPPLAMAAGSTWSSLDLPQGEILYTAQSDIRDYFYSLELPTSLQPLFCLPAIPHRLLQAWGVDERHFSEPDGQGWVFPHLVAVPMGWNWAMWLSQRAHQQIALEASGLGVDRVLVEGKPCPELASGKPVIIPYADNLNVTGINAELVQQTKDVVVKRLRELGFRVHEELDAHHTCQSLGFLIDGLNGTVSPIPERLDKICKAFMWLSRRPQVSGRSIERLLGHAVHICLLRRELLSIFRGLYDFAYSCYDRRVKLWPVAAKEARWAANLLKLCQADLKKTWSRQVTSSDASLSGIAVCKRDMEPAEQSIIGGMKEHWRYKSRIPVNPREAALSPLDPFSNPETVKPSEVQKQDPFELNEVFPEVPKKHLQKDLWHDVFAVHMTHPEHISLLEGRGVVAALRHKFRSSFEFNRKHLHFSDNLAVALLAAKGRSNNFQMLRVSRRIAALLLATGSWLSVRWIPSEYNVADRASRQWEHLRDSHVASRGAVEKRKKEIHARCYNKASIALGRTNFKESHVGDESKGEEEVKSHPLPAGADQRSEDQQSAGEDADPCGSSPVLGADHVREGGRFSTSCTRLSAKSQGAEAVCQKTEALTERGYQLRSGLLQVCESHVQSRVRPSRRKQNTCSNHGCVPRLFPQAHVEPNTKGTSGLGKAGTPTDKTSSPMAADSGDLHGTAEEEQEGFSSSNIAHVHSLPQTRRSSRRAATGFSATNARQQALLAAPSSRRTSSAVQGGAVGRVNLAGQPSSSMDRRHIIRDSHGSNIPTGYHLRSTGGRLEKGTQESWAGRESRGSISTETCRAQSRQIYEVEVTAGSQTKRPMGSRQQRQALRGPRQDQPGIPCSSKTDPKTLLACGFNLPGPGPKIFPPVMNGQSQRLSRNIVLELFSGCAALSKGCSQHGFLAIAYDIDYSSNCDLLQPHVVDDVLAFLTQHSNSVALVWMGTPCSSWSRARKHDGGPRPLRDDSANLLGFHDIPKKDQVKVQIGNQLLSVSAKIARHCMHLGISFVIENPYSSRIWLTEQMRSLVAAGASFGRTDFCGFKTPWRKATGFMFWQFPELPTIFKTCLTQNGRCSFSGRRHIILSGIDSQGVWLTRRAQPYPKDMCDAIAQQLFNHFSS